MSMLILCCLILLACAVTIGYILAIMMMSLSKKVSTAKFTIIGLILTFLFLTTLVAITKVPIPVA